jgi:hypothetical protein
MAKVIDFIYKSIFALVIPIAGFLLFWWTSLLFTTNEKYICISALSGLFLALIIDFFVFRKIRINIYDFPVWILVTVYLFYNIGMFGFFMGMPLFHPALALIAGYYWALRMLYHKIDSETMHAEILRVSAFTIIITCIIFGLSASIAFMDENTPNEVKNMLNLSFDFSKPIFIILVVTGGILVLAVQYWLTRLVMIKTIGSGLKKPD